MQGYHAKFCHLEGLCSYHLHSRELNAKWFREIMHFANAHRYAHRDMIPNMPVTVVELFKDGFLFGQIMIGVYYVVIVMGNHSRKFSHCSYEKGVY